MSGECPTNVYGLWICIEVINVARKHIWYIYRILDTLIGYLYI